MNRSALLGACVTLVLYHAAAAQGAPVRQSVSVDLAALVDGEVRASIEPIILGRTTLGVSVARWWSGGYGGSALAGGLATPGDLVPLAHPAREYMLYLSARVYPAAFSSSAPRHRVSGYLGAFVGLDRRELDQNYQTCQPGYACPLTGSGSTPAVICGCPVITSTSGSTTCQCPPSPGGGANTAVSLGVEPGAEIGIRAMPLQFLVLEIGGWARLITFPDPTGRFEEGQIDSRLTFSIGVSW
jgi:hypothetical protein